jgi:hypothetical protein
VKREWRPLAGTQGQGQGGAAGVGSRGLYGGAAAYSGQAAQGPRIDSDSMPLAVVRALDMATGNFRPQ